MTGRAALVLVAVLVSSLFSASAGAINVGAQIDRGSARVGDRLILTVNVEGDSRDIGRPDLPDMPAFRVQAGGSSQQVTWVNGQMSASQTFTYYLIPRREGDLVIPAIRVVVDGQPYTTVEIPVKIAASTARAPAREPAPSGSSARGDEHFVTMSVSSDSVVVGEQIILTFGFYRDAFSSFFETPEYTPPTTEGFWREDLPPERHTTKVIRSRRYDVTEIRYALFPTHAGELTVGEAVVRLPADVFGSFLRRRRQRQDEFLRADAIPIYVREMPRGAPASFSGTVAADLTIRADADRNELNAGEALSLSIELEGDGYLASASRPKLGEIDGFRIHDSGSSVDSRPLGEVLHGKLRIDKLLIAEREGEFEIPSIEYAYYDTGAKRYRVVRTDPIAVDVLPGSGTTSSVFTGGARSEIELLAQDIRHIRPLALTLPTYAGPLVARPLFWGLMATPGALWALSTLLIRRRQALLRDPRRLRRRRALETALSRVDNGDVHAGVYEYVAAQVDGQAAGLTRPRIESWVSEALAGAPEAGELLELLDRSDHLRFAGSAGDAQSLADQARTLLARIDRVVGRD